MIKKILGLVLVFLLTACGTEPEPTLTNVSTQTPLPTETFTPTPIPPTTNSPTPLPSATPTLIHIPEGGYYFAIPKGYQVDYQGHITNFADPDYEIFISLAGFLGPVPYTSAEEVIDIFVSELDSRDQLDLTLGEFYEYEIDGVIGAASDITGTILDEPMEGRAVSVLINQNHYFFALVTTQNIQKWNDQGHLDFEGALAAVQFDDSGVIEVDTCEVSNDDSYGYTEDNPIRVGGDWLEGPARERAFLDTLRGPNGEMIQYLREGSISTEGGILDIYAITYAGHPEAIVLYLDEYSYEDLMAPVGFTCGSNFPITAP